MTLLMPSMLPWVLGGLFWVFSAHAGSERESFSKIVDKAFQMEPTCYDLSLRYRAPTLDEDFEWGRRQLQSLVDSLCSGKLREDSFISYRDELFDQWDRRPHRHGGVLRIQKSRANLRLNRGAPGTELGHALVHGEEDKGWDHVEIFVSAKQGWKGSSLFPESKSQSISETQELDYKPKQWRGILLDELSTASLVEAFMDRGALMRQAAWSIFQTTKEQIPKLHPKRLKEVIEDPAPGSELQVFTVPGSGGNWLAFRFQKRSLTLAGEMVVLYEPGKDRVHFSACLQGGKLQSASLRRFEDALFPERSYEWQSFMERNSHEVILYDPASHLDCPDPGYFQVSERPNWVVMDRRVEGQVTFKMNGVITDTQYFPDAPRYRSVNRDAGHGFRMVFLVLAFLYGVPILDRWFRRKRERKAQEEGTGH